ncbi:MAG: RNA polymerase sigma factor [Candidatus Rokubacteria bacterium]|nr:RNA polymerase sigma factor [Candidatus Rokubacteria bacterium]
MFYRPMGELGFEALVEAHHAEIYRYVRRMTARTSEADDLSQETFLRAYRAWPSLPADANVRAWLFTIATNICRNHFRSERRRDHAHGVLRAAPPHSNGAGPEEHTLGDETRAVVEAIVARLPLKQRMAFVLRKVHELDYETIAATLGCSGDSARAHVFQALRKIRESMEITR